MPTKLYPEMQVAESKDNPLSVAVSLRSNVAGSSDIAFFIYQPPFLRGEDYPVLVQAWDNADDNIFDTL